MKIADIKLTGLTGGTVEGGWAEELTPEDNVQIPDLPGNPIITVSGGEHACKSLVSDEELESLGEMGRAVVEQKQIYLDSGRQFAPGEPGRRGGAHASLLRNCSMGGKNSSGRSSQGRWPLPWSRTVIQQRW